MNQLTPEPSVKTGMRLTEFHNCRGLGLYRPSSDYTMYCRRPTHGLPQAILLMYPCILDTRKIDENDGQLYTKSIKLK